MNDNYDVRYAVGPRETNQMGTQALRNEFLIQRPHKVHILKNKIEYISRDKLLKISLLYIEISINL